MTLYAKSAYGSNPHSGKSVNADHGWGGHAWPNGVPASLLSTLRFQGKLGTITVVARKELVPLIAVLMDITESKYGYHFRPGECWSYSNRAISGTNTPSNHSKGKAVDWNAPANPFSYTWRCDIPPTVVSLWESHGFYWGGRYVGQPTDPMHFEYVLTPGTVATMIASAEKILGLEDAKPTPSPNPTPTPNPKPPAPNRPSNAKITIRGLTAATYQAMLNGAGCPQKLIIDGVIGAKTTQATDWLQNKYNLTNDRYVGKDTLAALNKAAATGYPLKNGQVFGVALPSGKRSDGTPWAKLTRSGDPRWDGPDIRRYITAIQHMLGVNKDGVFGPVTESALKSRQKQWGIAVDGMCGTSSWKKLFYV